MLLNDLEDAAAIRLAREGDVEISRLQLKQAGQQLCVINIGAVRRIEVIPRAGMDPNALALF